MPDNVLARWGAFDVGRGGESSRGSHGSKDVDIGEEYNNFLKREIREALRRRFAYTTLDDDTREKYDLTEAQRKALNTLKDRDMPARLEEEFGRRRSRIDKQRELDRTVEQPDAEYRVGTRFRKWNYEQDADDNFRKIRIKRKFDTDTDNRLYRDSLTDEAYPSEAARQAKRRDEHSAERDKAGQPYEPGVARRREDAANRRKDALEGVRREDDENPVKRAERAARLTTSTERVGRDNEERQQVRDAGRGITRDPVTGKPNYTPEQIKAQARREIEHRQAKDKAKEEIAQEKEAEEAKRLQDEANGVKPSEAPVKKPDAPADTGLGAPLGESAKPTKRAMTQTEIMEEASARRDANAKRAGAGLPRLKDNMPVPGYTPPDLTQPPADKRDGKTSALTPAPETPAPIQTAELEVKVPRVGPENINVPEVQQSVSGPFPGGTQGTGKPDLEKKISVPTAWASMGAGKGTLKEREAAIVGSTGDDTLVASGGQDRLSTQPRLMTDTPLSDEQLGLTEAPVVAKPVVEKPVVATPAPEPRVTEDPPVEELLAAPRGARTFDPRNPAPQLLAAEKIVQPPVDTTSLRSVPAPTFKAPERPSAVPVAPQDQLTLDIPVSQEAQGLTPESIDTLPKPSGAHSGAEFLRQKSQEHGVNPEQVGHIPLQTDTPLPQEVYNETQPAKPTYDDPELSGVFRTATMPDVNVPGYGPVSHNSPAFDAVRKNLDLAQVGVGALVDADSGLRIGLVDKGIGIGIKAIDDTYGTKLHEGHEAATAAAEGDYFRFKQKYAKEPTNMLERLTYVGVQSLLPVPVKGGAGLFKEAGLGALIPGTFVRPGENMAAAYLKSLPPNAVINEALYRTYVAHDELAKQNQPVENKYGMPEPRVTSMSGSEAKALQKKIDERYEAIVPGIASMRDLPGIATLPPLSEASLVGTTLGAGAALGAGYLALRYGHRLPGVGNMLSRPVEGNVIADAARIPQQTTPVSITTPGEAFRTATQSSTHVLESQARRAGNEELAQRIPLDTGAGGEAQRSLTHTNGLIRLPHGQGEIDLRLSPEAHVEEYRQLTTAQQRELAQAKVIMNQVDLATARGGPGGQGHLVPPAGMPPQAQVANARRVLALPEYQAVLHADRAIVDATFEIAQRAGIRNAHDVAELRRTRPHFVHPVETFDVVNDGGTRRAKTYAEKFRDNHLGENTKPRSRSVPERFDLRTAADDPLQQKDPFLANVESLHENIKYAHEDAARREWIESARNHPATARSVVQLRPGETAPRNSAETGYYHNGERVRFAVEPSVARALEFNPRVAKNVFAQVKQIMESLTTGKYQPLFSMTSAQMEGALGTATKMPGMRLGHADMTVNAGMRAMGVQGAGLHGDILGAHIGIAEEMWKSRATTMFERSYKALQRDIVRDPSLMQQPLAQLIDNYDRRLARGLAIGQHTTIADLFDNARRELGELPQIYGKKHGILNSTNAELSRKKITFDPPGMWGSLVKHYGDVYGGHLYEQFRHYADEAAEKYSNLVRDTHESNKLQAIRYNRANIDSGQLPTAAARRDIRDLGGDLGAKPAAFKRGQTVLAPETGPVARALFKGVDNKFAAGVHIGMTDTIPYMNPWVQGLNRVSTSLRRNFVPTLTGALMATTVPTLTSLAWNAYLGPEYLDYMLNKRSGSDKARGTYFGKPGAHPDQGASLPFDHAFSILGHPTIEILDAIFDIRGYVARRLKKEPIEDERDGMVRSVFESLKETFGLGLPIPAQMGLAPLGYTPRHFPDLLDMHQKRSLQSQSGLPNSVDLVLNTVIGQMGKIGVHFYSAMHESYIGGRPLTERIAAGLEQGQHDLEKLTPMGGPLFGATKPYSSYGTALSDRATESVAAGSSILKSLDQYDLHGRYSKNKHLQEDKILTPNMAQARSTREDIPPELIGAHKLIKAAFKGPHAPLAPIFTELSRIRKAETDMKKLNAGNIGGMVKFPLPEHIIGGNDYIIMSKEDVKDLAQAELDSILHPDKTPKGRKKKRQPDHPLFERMLPTGFRGRLERLPTNDEKLRALNLHTPTLADVDQSRNALNRRRSELDGNASVGVHYLEREIESKTGKKVTLPEYLSRIKTVPNVDSATGTWGRSAIEDDD